MAEPGKKPFNYERAKQLMQSEGKSPGFYNELETRILEYEKANGITGGVGQLEADEIEAPAGQDPEGHVTELPAVQIEGDPDQGLWESLTDANDYGDLGRGAAQGASFGLADEGSALLQSWLGSPNEGQRAVGRGADAPLMTPEQERAAMLADERGANAQAQERSPWLYGAGQVAGSLPSAIATAPVMGAGLGVRAGQAALHGAALGAAHGYGASEGETDAEILDDASRSAALGGGLGAGGTVVGAGVGAVAKKAGEGLQRLATTAQKAGWRNRGVAPGTYGGELAQMTRQQGRDLVENIGRTIEKHGAHKRPESSMLPGFVPQGAGVYADTLTTALNRVGQGMGSSIDDATAAGAQVDPKALAAALREAQAGHLAKGQPNNMAVADGLDEIARDIGERTVNRGAPMTPRDAWNYRNDMKPTAKLEGSRNVMPAVGDRGQAFREGRDVIRGAIEEAMPPPQRAQFQEANTDYGLLKKAHNAALKREAQETGNQIMSINTPGMAGAGAMLGGSPGAAVSIFSGEALKRVGRDGLADVFGGTSAALRGASRAATATGDALAPTGEAARLSAPALADDADSILEQFLGSGSASPAAAQPQTQRDAGEHPQAARVRLALQARPAILGDYGPELEAALQKGSKEFGATMMRLQRDPEFMRQVMPALQGAKQ